MSVAKNLEEIRKQISKITDPKKISILGVCKKQPLEKIQEGVRLGIRLLGNNQVQEGKTLRRSLKENVEWHFIGHIQSKKAKDLVDYDVIQTLDRIEVAERISQRIEKTMRCLVEVNIGGEAQKSGINPDSLENFLNELKKFPKLKVEGLMCIPPLIDLEKRRKYFKEMKIYLDKFDLETLSMGMSEDYLVAIEEGATLIRLGMGLFGDRTG